jgi:hypothetical protein
MQRPAALVPLVGGTLVGRSFLGSDYRHAPNPPHVSLSAGTHYTMLSMVPVMLLSVSIIAPVVNCSGLSLGRPLRVLLYF